MVPKNKRLLRFEKNLYFYLGVAQIIRWEQALEKGQNIEAEIAAAGLPKTVTIEVPFTSTRGMNL